MQREAFSVRTYVSVFVALLALLGLTVGAALVDLGPFNTPLALGIAAVKALLVILYFMHLRQSDRLTWVFAGVGFFWLLILLGLVLADYIARVYGVPVGA